MHIISRSTTLSWGALAVIGAAIMLWSVAVAMFILGIHAHNDADFFAAANFLAIVACVPTGVLVVRRSRRRVLADNRAAREEAYGAVARAVVNELERRGKPDPAPSLRSV